MGGHMRARRQARRAGPADARPERPEPRLGPRIQVRIRPRERKPG